jgi:peptidyl-prolyl cis-trans isomerase SurA
MLTKHTWIFLLVIIISCNPKSLVNTQEKKDNESSPLLTIGDTQIPSDEFEYILSKSKSFQEKEEKLTFEEFEENLELFINFKLKAKEAEKLGLHEVEEFHREFEMFKSDLIKPFLIKNSLQEGELMKAYNRLQEIIKASHILLQFPANTSKEDSIAVFRMAQKIKLESEKNVDFNKLAAQYSDDPSAKDNKGSLGYFTALQMVYPFEDAAYSLNPGEISDPVLTNFGYHIIKVEDRKPNPGEIKIAHILVRTTPGDLLSEERALRKIGDIYIELQNPDSQWEDVCQEFSEDLSTKNKGGVLNWISVGTVIPEFEQVAFNLTEIGEISAPVKTPFGYHVLRLEDTRPLQEYDEMASLIKSRLLRDSRSTLIQSQVVAIQKSKYDFEENTDMVTLIKSIFDNQPKNQVNKVIQEKQLMDSVLFTIQNKAKTVGQFLEYIDQEEKNTRNQDPKNFFETWKNKYEEHILSLAEEKDLTENNEEFKMLINEYRDGILMFSLMNEKVWQKAIEDSVGQYNFYVQNIQNYQWKERREGLIVRMDGNGLTNSIRRFLSDKKYQSNLESRLENTFLNDNPYAFTIESGPFEIESHEIFKNADLKKPFQEILLNGKTHFLVLGEKINPQPKKLEETKGKVIQDYQEYLEKELMSNLRNSYKIWINEDEKQKMYEKVVNH